ncbi:MAG: response regulator, partial [Methanothrix sp.]
FLMPDMMHEFRSLINIAAQGKFFAGLELQRRKKDGAAIEISLSSAPIRDAKGSVQGIMSVLDDITKKKAAERSLRENLHFMQKLMDTIPNPIICKNMDGRFIRCNLAFEKFVNLSRGQIVGKTDYDIFPPDLAAFCSASDAALFAEPGIRIEEIAMQLHDGRKADIISNKATYTNENGTLAGLVEVIIDITDLKTSEAELRAAKEAAEEAARAKAEFLANMSHEIRTPLNAIIGMTGLLLDAGLSMESKDAVETIRSSGDTLLVVINDILDFSKIDSGNMELERLPFDLSTCVEESLDLVAAKAAEKGLNLAYLMDEGTPKAILGDLTRLRQILVNLISNAVKFTNDGEVVVSVSSRHLVDEYHEIRFSIKDTGIGISEFQKNRLFRSFSQIDASTSRKYGGTGLGLAISRRLVELMGGRIWVDSESGKGSDFQFTIVTEARAANPKAHQLPSQPKLAGKKLLIVDGFETNLKILDSMAKCWGMKPTVASGPMDALDRMRGEVWDVVVMSTSISGMDPVSFANEVRANQTSVPIVLCTTFGRKRDDCNQFASFLSKPIKPALLHEALLNIFDGKASKNSLQEKTPPAVHHPLRILLAEDNAVNQKVALKMLKKIGYRADLAANGLEVLQALERLPYDVVLMDVQMPEMDGLEATRRIRELWPSGGPQVVAITAYAMEGDRERCLGAGMDDYISKPVQIQELAGALGRCQAAMEGMGRTRFHNMQRQAKDVS